MGRPLDSPRPAFRSAFSGQILEEEVVPHRYLSSIGLGIGIDKIVWMLSLVRVGLSDLEQGNC